MRYLTALGFFLVALSASAHPGSAIAVDAKGIIYFVDTGSGVYRVDAGGKLTRIPGPAFHWMALDSDGRFAKTQWPSIPGAEFKRTEGNPGLILSSDYSATIGRDGAFYFAHAGRITKVNADGSTKQVVVLPGSIQWVNGLAPGPGGALYYTENTAVRRLTTDGRVETVASNVTVRDCERTPSDDVDLGAYLRGLHVMADGTVYVAASGCGALLKITPAGAVTTILRMHAPWSPTAVTAYGKTLYVLEYLHTASDDRREWKPRIRKIEPNGTMSIIATVNR